jgi:hypothetical protein
MIKLNLKQAKITSISDPDELGKIQVRVIPDLMDVKKEELLPWVSPFISLLSTNTKSMFLPEVGGFVWVFFVDEEMYLDGFYIPAHFNTGAFEFDSIKNNIDGISELGNVTYPSVNYFLTKAGNLYFENTTNGECGILHKSGAYQVISSGGSFYIKNGNGNITLLDTGTVAINDNFTVEV